MTQQPETPEGWKWEGPCLTRVHDGKFAVLELDQLLDGAYPSVHVARGHRTTVGYMEFTDAVLWANDKLGVPKPVEVVEREFADGSVLIHDTENKRWSGVHQYSGVWVVLNVGRHMPTKEVALEAAREYVRGAQ